MCVKMWICQNTLLITEPRALKFQSSSRDKKLRKTHFAVINPTYSAQPARITPWSHPEGMCSCSDYSVKESPVTWKETQYLTVCGDNPSRSQGSVSGVMHFLDKKYLDTWERDRRKSVYMCT